MFLNAVDLLMPGIDCKTRITGGVVLNLNVIRAAKLRHLLALPFVAVWIAMHIGLFLGLNFRWPVEIICDGTIFVSAVGEYAGIDVGRLFSGGGDLLK